MTSPWLLAPLEKGINLALALDPETRRQMSGLHGRIIAFELTGTGLELLLIPTENGALQIYQDPEAQPDCLIRGSPLALAGMLGDDRAKPLFQGTVEIQGDQGLAHRFSDILRAMEIDWEGELAKLTGDALAHQAGRTLRGAGDWLRQTWRTEQTNLGEYLTEEARLLPTRYELQEWLAAVDQLRDDTERLTARIAILEQRRQP
jgi:ubiquinone biosynthesis protein UbiJ